MKIRIGDNVVVIAGKDKGQIGTITAINKKTNRVLVEGINIRTIHVKPTQANPEGGIEKKEGSISASNVMINIGDTKDASKAKATKVAYKVQLNKNNKKEKVRIAKATGEEI